MSGTGVGSDEGAAASGSQTLADWQKGTVEAWEEQRRKPWQVYVDAELGFRNHWYPALFSHEVAEGEPVRAVEHERRSIGGRAYAVPQGP